MIIIQAYKDYWKRAFDFKGKTKRKEFWWAILGLIIVNQIVSFLPDSFKVFIGLYVLANIVAGISLNIRRLRDVGKNWQWIFINLVPFLGGIVMIIFLCYPSDSFKDFIPKQFTNKK